MKNAQKQEGDICDCFVPVAWNRRGYLQDLVYPLHKTSASLSEEGGKNGIKIACQPQQQKASAHTSPQV